jgi:hypothetical protein
MSVKSRVIQLELNDIGYKLIFHSYSKFASTTWYTFIWKFEKYKPNPQKLHGYDHNSLLDFYKKEIGEKKEKRIIKGVEK